MITEIHANELKMQSTYE